MESVSKPPINYNLYSITPKLRVHSRYQVQDVSIHLNRNCGDGLGATTDAADNG